MTQLGTGAGIGEREKVIGDIVKCFVPRSTRGMIDGVGVRHRGNVRAFQPGPEVTRNPRQLLYRLLSSTNHQPINPIIKQMIEQSRVG